MSLDDHAKIRFDLSTPASKQSVACENCMLYGFKQLLGESEEIPGPVLDSILVRQQPIVKGETLFRIGQPFHAIFAVKSGCFKSYLIPTGGDEQVLGFHLPGELLGLDAFLSPRYGCSVRALVPSTVCQLSLINLDMSDAQFSKFQEQVIRVLTSQIAQERRQSLLAGRQTAEERLAAFLVNLSDRYTERGLAGETFQLAMLRPDIASYLGLSMETVSRTLTRFKEQKLLKINGKNIQLLDMPCLRSIAQHCPVNIGKPA